MSLKPWCFFGPLLLSFNALATNVHVTVVPTATVIAPGATTSVDLLVSYDGTDSLLGGALSFSFNADLLEVTGIALHAPQDVAGTTGTVVVQGSVGSIQGMGFATFDGIAGNFMFATLEFRSRESGGTSTLDVLDAQDPIFEWVSSSLEPITVSSTASSISVVPEPATLPTMVVGIVVLSELRRRRRHGTGS